MTPPRSISPISMTGTSAARAKPMLAMSFARRLISDALPAPSTRTRSASAFSRAKLSSTAGSSFALLGLIFARLRPCRSLRPCTMICAPSRSRLQQHGVHVDARRHARGARLQRLGPADLAAVGCHGGVVRHVLRLERHDANAAVRE